MAYVQNLEEDKDSQQQTNTAGAAPVQTGAGQGVAIGGTGSTPAGQKASSGRFTNIQKYLGANQNAGQEIAGNVANQVDKNVQQNKIQASDKQSIANQSIGTSKDTIQRGQGYQSELSDNPFAVANSSFSSSPVAAQSLNPNAQKTNQAGTIFDENLGNKYQDFVNDQNKLQDFTKFRFGKNIDETALTNQGQDQQQAAGSFQTQAQTEAQRVKDENGRFGLLKQTFARPNYTTGQQRMDNVFFGTSGKAGIGKVQNVANQNVNLANQFGQSASQNVNDIANITKQNQQLATDLTGQATTLNDTFKQMLQNRYDPTKKAYADEVARYNKNIGLLTKAPGENSTGALMDEDIWNQTGLREGQQAFNALTGKQLSDLADINDISGRQLNNQDVSKQGDVNTLLALNALSKSNLDADGNVLKNYTDEYNTAGNLGNAVTLKNDASGIQGRISQATQDFLNNANAANLTGQNTQSYNRGWLQGSGHVTRTASANIGDLLRAAGVNTDASQYAYVPNAGAIPAPSTDGTNTSPVTIKGNDGLIYGNNPGNALVAGGAAVSMLPMLSTQNLLGDTGSQFVDQLLNTVGNFGGGTGTASGDAARWAKADLQAQIDKYLQEQGYKNTVSQSGIRRG